MHTLLLHPVFLLLTFAQLSDVTSVGWMAGCWRQESPGRTVDEVWMAPDGDGMLGMSRTVQKGRITEHEFLQVRVKDGQLVYIAKPSGQPEAAFTAKSASAREVIFENLRHDFPQRIIYRLQPDGNMAARVEGTMNGQTKGIDFAMKKVSCP
jgi:hypothetical protein